MIPLDFFVRKRNRVTDADLILYLNAYAKHGNSRIGLLTLLEVAFDPTPVPNSGVVADD
jgi:hypothetical protein